MRTAGLLIYQVGMYSSHATWISEGGDEHLASCMLAALGHQGVLVTRARNSFCACSSKDEPSTQVPLVAPRTLLSGGLLISQLLSLLDLRMCLRH